MKVAIAGAGKLGLGLTEVLIGGGNDITLIDSSADVIRRTGDIYDVMAVCADARKASELEKIDISSYDMLIACTDDDERNIFICSLAKKLGCRSSVARVRSPEHMDQTDLVKNVFGVDLVVNPDYACGNEIYKYLYKSVSDESAIDVKGADVLTFCADQIPGLNGKKLMDIDVFPSGSLVTAVSRNGNVIIPNGSTELQTGDSLYLICPEGTADELRTKLNNNEKSKKLKRVMIAGGGRTGFYLAQSLSENGVSVKIVEKDTDRCEFLSSALDRVLVLHGNAADNVLLKNENLAGMDAFVAATDSDETNILLAMLAQENGVENVVAKVSHNYFRQFAEVLKDTMTINPVEMCISEILNYSGRDTTILFSRMVQGQAEFLEIIAEDGMYLTEKTLAELDIPSGVLIAGITRDGSLVIPSGSTQIAPGDNVIIFSKLASAGELEGLITKHKSHAAQG